MLMLFMKISRKKEKKEKENYDKLLMAAVVNLTVNTLQ